MDAVGEAAMRRQAEEQAKAQQATTQQQMDSMMGQYTTNPNAGFSLYGTDDEKLRQAANLTQTGAMTGMNMFDIGARSGQYDQRLQQRLNGGDPVSQYMMGQKNRSMAQMNRSMAGKGVAGGVAGASAMTASNSADEAINKQKYSNDRTNNQDLYNWVKRNQKVTGEALAMGADQGLADQMDTNAGSGITVICGELHRQGLMDDETYQKDHLFGLYVRENWPYAMDGYHFWAKPVVKLMQKSKIFTKVISCFALPWAEYMSGHPNILGQFLMSVGLPMCEIIGYLISTKKTVRA